MTFSFVSGMLSQGPTAYPSR